MDPRFFNPLRSLTLALGQAEGGRPFREIPAQQAEIAMSDVYVFGYGVRLRRGDIMDMQVER